MRTIVGMVITRDGHARQAYLHQPEPELVGPLTYRARPVELRHQHFAVNALEVRSAQARWIPIDRDHDPDQTCGQVEALELDRNGALWMVGSVHDGAIPAEPGPLYLSPATRSRSDGTDLTIEAVAIVPKGAQICLEPITVHPGLERWRDWRDGIERRHAGLVERAAVAHRSRRRDDPIVVHDLDPARAEARELRELQGLERRRGTGPIEYGPPGHILSVR